MGTSTLGSIDLQELKLEHLEDLRESGLNDETIVSAGIQSAEANEVKWFLGFEAGPGLLFPYEGHKSGRRSYTRVKLDDKTLSARYRSPKDSTNRLYVPANLPPDVLDDPAQTLFITEGEKKALKGCQEGLPVIAVSGVWSWCTNPTGDESQPIPDLNKITWKGREVVIAFDSDILENKNVQTAEAHLAKELARRGATVYGVRFSSCISDKAKAGLDDFLTEFGVEAFNVLDRIQLAKAIEPLGLAGGRFLTEPFEAPEEMVEGLLSTQGNGFIAGEEKLGKSLYALEEALCLALGEKVCGTFTVPKERRVLFIEEEDPPQRVQARINALLHGHDLNVDETLGRLDQKFRTAVWTDFSLDSEKMVDRLEATLTEFRPNIVYLDALRKLTTKDLNKPDQAGIVLGILDRLRRRYGVIFRVVHHFRKAQQFRQRGSQELSGAGALGAWVEDALYFFPLGRHGGTRVTLQRKDGAFLDPFKLRIETEGPALEPTRIRLHTEEISTEPAAEQRKERVYQAVAALPATLPSTGEAGVSLRSIRESLGFKTDKALREDLKELEKAERVKKVGKATKGADLWKVCKA